MRGKKTGGRTKDSIISTVPVKSVREYFAFVFQELQMDTDQDWTLQNWARLNPDKFYLLASKLIPTEITGKDGAAIQPIYILAPSDKGRELIKQIE
jgi:hypothetical protein